GVVAVRTTVFHGRRRRTAAGHAARQCAPAVSVWIRAQLLTFPFIGGVQCTLDPICWCLQAPCFPRRSSRRRRIHPLPRPRPQWQPRPPRRPVLSPTRCARCSSTTRGFWLRPPRRCPPRSTPIVPPRRR